MDDAVKLRELVRAALNLAQGYWFNDAMLVRAVNNMLPKEAKESEVLQAAEWNLGKEYIDTRKNDDTDQREWKITKAGIAKESI
jgi:hypothetical protein